jgi:signal transduction histidine kinase
MVARSVHPVLHETRELGRVARYSKLFPATSVDPALASQPVSVWSFPLPRSIVAWFAVCWGLFLVAALVVGAMLIALYKETTSQRTERAAANLGRACEAVLRELHGPPSGGGSGAAASDYVSSVTRALEPFAGVEGGIWKASSGSLAYAFPSYEGSGQKTDLPQAEEPTIRQVVETAIIARRPVEWKRDARSQIMLIQACPFPDGEAAAWTMTRVVTVGGRPFLLATTGLAFLLIVLLGSAALLGRVLWRWSQRLRTVESALATGAEDLPVLQSTGQRDLDRIVRAINGAGAKAREFRRRTESLQKRVAEGERLAALGRVAAGVAHEIRNPISAMRLKAENALASEANRRRSTDALHVVVEQVGRMDQLLQKLLRSVQRSEIKRQPVTDIREFLAAHASLFCEQAGKRPISVEVPDHRAPVEFDTAAIGGALDNLILNAIQNSNDGAPIVLRAEIEGGRLRLSVSDVGHGVPETIRDHLFEPFATGRPDGTGLGLAIVREVAEAHGGSARVQHRDDGTTFTMDIPIGPQQ